jgi:hypothetical protein
VADTNTPNIGLLLPDLGDTFNFALHVENNFSTIDSMLGAVQCTSSTRPSNTYAGQIVYETDSKRYAQNTGTKASPTWTYTSHAALAVTAATHPTSGLSTGELIYETDTKFVQVYNGSAFEQKAYANFTCTSSAHPASPFTGMEIYETDTGLNAVWSGSTWVYPVQKIASTVLGASAASITLTIPSSINHIRGAWNARKDVGGGGAFSWLRFNGDSASHYQWVNEIGNTAQGNSGASLVNFMQAGLCAGASDTAAYFSNNTFEMENIQGSNAKGFASQGNLICSGTTYYIAHFGGIWNQANAVTSVTLLPDAGNLVAGSSFSIEGWS